MVSRFFMMLFSAMPYDSSFTVITERLRGLTPLSASIFNICVFMRLLGMSRILGSVRCFSHNALIAANSRIMTPPAYFLFQS
jgi:hypothetical protein